MMKIKVEEMTMENILDISLDDLFKDTKPMRKGRAQNKAPNKTKQKQQDRGQNRGRKRGGPQLQGPNSSSKRRRQSNGNRGAQNNWLYVTADSDVKRTAGAVAHGIRRGESPRLVCTGKAAINQAVKSLAISRVFLAEEGLDFKVYPTVQPERERSDSIFLKVSSSGQSSIQPGLDVEGAQILTSTERAKASKIGGKIAHTIREGMRVVVRSVGPGAAWRFVQSLMLAKEFVRTDDNLDLSFRAQFVTLLRQAGGEESEVTALQFHVYAEEI